MAHVGNITLDAGELARDRLAVSLKLVGLRAVTFRARLFGFALRLIGWISPVPVVVELIEHEART